MNKKSPVSISAVIFGGVILILLAFINGSFYSYKNYRSMEARQKKYLSELLYPNQKEEGAEISNVTSDWKIYKNRKYSFEIKYPKDWLAPEENLPKNSSEKYELKISFKNNPIKIKNPSAQKLLASKPKNYQEKKMIEKFDLGIEYSEISDKQTNPKTPKKTSNNTYRIEKDKGFDVFIYSLEKLSASSKDNSVINKKYSLETIYNFNNLNASITNPSQCYKERVPLTKDDFYFEKAYFYNISHEKYAFNIVPYYNGKNDTAIQTNDSFPEFYQSLFSLGFVQEPLIIPSPLVKRKSFVARGTMKCVHGGKPQMSKTKGRHVDEDCCPDPDEWPMPGCAYSAKDYAIMLSGPPSSKLAKSKK